MKTTQKQHIEGSFQLTEEERQALQEARRIIGGIIHWLPDTKQIVDDASDITLKDRPTGPSATTGDLAAAYDTLGFLTLQDNYWDRGESESGESGNIQQPAVFTYTADCKLSTTDEDNKDMVFAL